MKAKPSKAHLPKVLLIGRPNTGKSTLFNRIAGKKESIVYPTPGVTRDMHGMEADWNGRRFMLYDAAGLETGAVPGSIMAGAKDILNREARAMDLIVLVVDGREGLTTPDEDAVAWARMLRKPTILAVNKLENPKNIEMILSDFYQLGITPTIPTSGEHGQGLGDLLDTIVEMLPPKAKGEGEDRGLILLLGRPNVGKSTLFNTLLGRERSVVHATAGTTRDLVREPFALPGGGAMLADAAGLMKGLIGKEDIQFYSEQRVKDALKEARLVLMCFRAGKDGITHHDRTLFFNAQDECDAMAVLILQSDLSDMDIRDDMEKQLEKDLFVQQPYPFLWISSVKGKNLDQLKNSLDEWLSQGPPQIDKETLREMLERWKVLAPPPIVRGKKNFLKKLTMPRPGTFVLSVGGQGKLPVSYMRRLRNQLFQELPITPWVIHFKVNYPKPKP